MIGNTQDTPSQIRIDQEFKLLIPPLSKDEYSGLEASLKSEGCRDSIVIWNDVIIDGHNRHEICVKNNIPFKTHAIDLPDRDAVIDWMYSNQLSRRNLTDTVKMVLIGKQYAHRKKQRGGSGSNQYINTSQQRDQNDLSAKTADTIAREQGISQGTVKRAEKLAEAVETIGDLIGPEAKEEILKETVKISQKEIIEKAQELKETPPAVIAEIKETTKQNGIKNSGLFTSDSEEWYTPSEILNSVYETFDNNLTTDPCSPINNPRVKATTHITQNEDGLKQSWPGTVFMNPPYGNVIGDWVKKALSEYTNGHATEIIILVPARTDTAWFQSLVDYPWCAVKGRLKFSDSKNSAPFPSAIFYIGENVKAFFENFEQFGTIFRKVDRMEADVS